MTLGPQPERGLETCIGAATALLGPSSSPGVTGGLSSPKVPLQGLLEGQCLVSASPHLGPLLSDLINEVCCWLRPVQEAGNIFRARPSCSWHILDGAFLESVQCSILSVFHSKNVD